MREHSPLVTSAVEDNVKCDEGNILNTFLFLKRKYLCMSFYTVSNKNFDMIKMIKNMYLHTNLMLMH